MDASLARRIRDDNRRMHDAPGYADFYDDQLALIRNPWEQRLFREDLARIAARLPAGFRALDLGCGTGNLTLKLLALGASVTGVDLSAGMIDRLRRKAAGVRAASPPSLNVSDVDEFLDACGEPFDLVCACSFLHHLPNYLATAARAADHVAPGGAIYFVHEPLPPDRADLPGRLLEWIDFRWQRFEARTGLGGRVARTDPYYEADCLADYWAMTSGIDDDALARVLECRGLSVRTMRYDSKRHRLLHVVSRWLRTEHLLRIEGRRD
ncbi:MAG: class I SAM-dependent methyltransferase [Phycisphaerae bacterium]|nr:class I SAM-dependent methyltransferase [Phycisphaerae bacterium]